MKVRGLGVIGGSSLQMTAFLREATEKTVKTPFGPPSDSLWVRELEGLKVVLIQRHGRGHTIPANRVNHRANIWALHNEGVSHIIASSSSGSLKKSIQPGRFLVPDDFICFWNVPTLREDVHHPTPILDEELRGILRRAAKGVGADVIDGGTYIQTLGPRLETRAEIRLFKDYGEILGMTMSSEATLACELDLRYASLCTVDNYCNGIIPKPLTYDQIVLKQKENSQKLTAAMSAAVEMFS